MTAAENLAPPASRPAGLDQAGQTLVLLAFLIVVLIAFVGLAVDVAMLMAERDALIRLTDASALAAASALSGAPNDTTAHNQAIARAREYALLHGFDPDDAANSFSVTFPASTPPRKLVQVTASRPVTLAFMPVLPGVPASLPVSSGARQAEGSSLDIVIVQDVSASQCEQNYNAESYGGGWCSMLHRPDYPSDERSDSFNPASVTTHEPQSGTYPIPGRDWFAGTSYYNVPWAPFYQQQDAARSFVDRLDGRYDQIALVSFSSDVNSGESPYGQYNGEARTHYSLRLATDATKTAIKNVIGLSPATIGQRGVAWGSSPPARLIWRRACGKGSTN